MDVLVTCKYEEDPIKNEGARVVTTLYSNFSDTQGQITLVLVSVSGRNLNSSKFSCMSSFPAKMRMIDLTSSPKGNDRSPESNSVFLNSSQVSKRFFFFNWSRAASSAVYGWTISDVNQGSKLCCKFAKKMMPYNPNVCLINDNVYTKFD